jgi:carbonic anhydrase
MSKISAYQSPILLNKRDAIHIHQPLEIIGINHHAIYDASSKIFIIQKPIYLVIENKKYKWLEYHFHIPAEHIVQNKEYKAEIHYVFKECDSMADCDNDEIIDTCADLCGCCHSNDPYILVIGRTISDTKEDAANLYKLQPKLPLQYFEYDGTLTTGTYSPVRWLVGLGSISLSIKDIVPFAKTARLIQPFDGRIKLFCHNCSN